MMKRAILPWKISDTFFAGIVRNQSFGSRGGAENAEEARLLRALRASA